MIAVYNKVTSNKKHRRVLVEQFQNDIELKSFVFNRFLNSLITAAVS